MVEMVEITCEECEKVTRVETEHYPREKVYSIKLICNHLMFVCVYYCLECKKDTVSHNSKKEDFEAISCYFCRRIRKREDIDPYAKQQEEKRRQEEVNEKERARIKNYKKFNIFQLLFSKELKHSSNLQCPKCNLDTIFFQFELKETKVHCSFCGELSLDLKPFKAIS